ncbi:hypothetical protein [uncultured Streptomyces sp.]|uniref:hypothetical protein n=1 Tax=uncultured Streptomyces sp. TaxID=174707 RepID=UPI00262F7750|nr:hypothetical protein [uncultured Streptomyces sp.]
MWLVLGLVLLAPTGGTAHLVRGLVADEQAYLGARPCGEGESPAGADCLWTVGATVVSAGETRSGKARVFRVIVREHQSPPSELSVDFGLPSELAEHGIRPGAEVEITSWRATPVSMRHGGITEEVNGGMPDEMASPVAGFALSGLWLSALCLVAAFRSHRRIRRASEGLSVSPRVPFGTGKFAAVALVPGALGIVSNFVQDGWTSVIMTAVLTAAVAVPLTILALGWDREPGT